jgi:tRNA A-37 threonylcarbamoyl transferase component Bud32
LHPSSSNNSGFVGPQRVGGASCWVRPDRAESLGLDREALRSLLRMIVDRSYRPQRTFKDDRRSLVEWFEHAGRRWLVKRYRGAPARLWIGHVLRGAVAWREARAALKLARLGLRVSEPLALMHAGGPWRCTQTLVMPYVEGTSLHNLLYYAAAPAQRSPADRQRRLAIARSVGRQIGRLTAAGYINRDHKPSNLIIDDPQDAPRDQPCLIDPAGIRRRRSDQQVLRMIARTLSTAVEAGHFTAREAMTCLRGIVEADPTLAPHRPRRLRDLADRIRLLA